MIDDFPRWRPGWDAHFSHREPDWRRHVWLRPNPSLDYHEGSNAYALTIDGYELAQERWGSSEVDEMLSRMEGIARAGFAADFIDLRIGLFLSARSRCWSRKWDLSERGDFEGFLMALDRAWDREAEGHWAEWPDLPLHEQGKSRGGE
jgi:hypothetical protein